MKIKVEVPIEISEPKVISENQDVQTVEFEIPNHREIENIIFREAQVAIIGIFGEEKVMRSGSPQDFRKPMTMVFLKEDQQ